jgi:hypothetical protein
MCVVVTHCPNVVIAACNETKAKYRTTINKRNISKYSDPRNQGKVRAGRSFSKKENNAHNVFQVLLNVYITLPCIMFS